MQSINEIIHTAVGGAYILLRGSTEFVSRDDCLRVEAQFRLFSWWLRRRPDVNSQGRQTGKIGKYKKVYIMQLQIQDRER